MGRMGHELTLHAGGWWAMTNAHAWRRRATRRAAWSAAAGTPSSATRDYLWLTPAFPCASHPYCLPPNAHAKACPPALTRCVWTAPRAPPPARCSRPPHTTRPAQRSTAQHSAAQCTSIRAQHLRVNTVQPARLCACPPARPTVHPRTLPAARSPPGCSLLAQNTLIAVICAHLDPAEEICELGHQGQPEHGVDDQPVQDALGEAGPEGVAPHAQALDCTGRRGGSAARRRRAGGFAGGERS